MRFFKLVEIDEEEYIERTGDLDFNLYKKRYSNVEKNINNNNKEYSFNWIEHF